MPQPVAATEEPKLILPGLSPSTVSAIKELESLPPDAAEANLAEDEADIVAAVNEVAAESDGMRGGGKTPAELLEERRQRALLRHNSRQAAARAIAKEVSKDANKLKADLEKANTTGMSWAKLFAVGLASLVSAGPIALTGREMHMANSVASSQQKIFTEVCSTSAKSAFEVQDLQTNLDILKASNLGLGPLMGTTKEQQELDYKKLIATMNERMCTDKRASYAVAVAAVAAARVNTQIATFGWFVGTASASVVAFMVAAVEACRTGNSAPLKKLVNDAWEKSAQTVSGATVSGAPAAEQAQVPAAAVAEQPVALGEAPASLAAAAPPRRSRGGRRTYRKAKRAGRTRKSRR